MVSSESVALPFGRVKGIILVLIGAILWGTSGTVAQFLFQKQGFSAEWLVVIRLLVSGVLLLLFAYQKEGSKVWGVWKERGSIFQIILFGICGMLAVQYTYFAAIQHGNAATATVLQYMGPVIITCYLAIVSKRLPSVMEISAVALAVVGTYLLVTGGSVRTLSISGWAVFWGISSAFALAFYTLQPIRLLKKWGSMIVVGWGMLIGGVGFSFIHPPWKFEGEWSLPAYFAVVFVVIFGTLVAFYCYLESLRYISATETSLLACAEPLSAAFLSVIWLHVAFGAGEWIGTFFILTTIVILARIKGQ